MKNILIVFITLFIAGSCNLSKEEDYTQVQAEALELWKDMRFGLFVHWGPSVNFEPPISWSRGDKITIEEYDQLYKKFNPVKFDSDAWVQTAKSAGTKYIIFITKHHDGFCLWPSEYTDYDIAATPFERDVVKELSESCRSQDIRFGTYYSVADWYHPDFWTRSPAGKLPNPNTDRESYMNYLESQVTELIKNYGPLCTMWFDISKGIESQHSLDVVKKIRQLQPDIIINNRVGNGYGDHLTPEQQIGAYNRDEAWESCMTMSSHWLWKKDDILKSTEECLTMLMYTAGGDGNLLLNTGPMPDGRIEPRQAEILEGMGDWLGEYGDCIYGTRGGPYKPSIWGASTCKGNDLYLMVMKWDKDHSLTLPPLPYTVEEIQVLTGGKVDYTHTETGLKLTMSGNDQAIPASVIKLTLNGEVFDIEPMVVPEVYDAISTRKPVRVSSTQPKGTRYIAEHAVDGYSSTKWMSEGKDKNPWIEVDLGDVKSINKALIMEELDGLKYYKASKGFQFQVKSGEEWVTIHEGNEIGDRLELNFKPVSGRFFRIYFTQIQTNGAIREFQLFEE